jgi:hypothetical protein
MKGHLKNFFYSEQKAFILFAVCMVVCGHVVPQFTNNIY